MQTPRRGEAEDWVQLPMANDVLNHDCNKASIKTQKYWVGRGFESVKTWRTGKRGAPGESINAWHPFEAGKSEEGQRPQALPLSLSILAGTEHTWHSLTTCCPTSPSPISCNWEAPKQLLFGKETQEWIVSAVTPQASEAKDHPIPLHLPIFNKILPPRPHWHIWSHRSPTLTSQVHAINLLCFAKSFLLRNQNPDWVEASPALPRGCMALLSLYLACPECLFHLTIPYIWNWLASK